MTGTEETVIELSAQVARLEQDLDATRKAITKSFHEVQGARDQVRKAKDRLKHFQDAQDFIRKEALIVSFVEFYAISKGIRENKSIIEQYEAIANSAQAKGRSAADQLKNLESQLQEASRKLSAYGKIIPFPFKGPSGNFDAPEDSDQG